MAGTQFCLEWDSHSRNICNGLSSLQQNGEFVDMTLAADGHHVKVHQMVLALASPYLKELITSANCPHPVIFLNKVSYKTLCFILEYIYTGQTQVAVEDIRELITAAKELHIKGLEDVKSTAGGMATSDAGLNLEEPPAEAPEIQLKMKLPDTSAPLKTNTTNISTLKRKLEIGSLKKNPSSMPLRKRMVLNKPNTDTEEGNMDMPELTNEENSDASKSFGFDDPLEVDDRNDGSDDDNHENYSTANVAIKQPASDNSQNLDCSLQYTISNQGAIQLILNRYMYSLNYRYRDNRRQWKCVDGRDHKCPAKVVTKDNVVIRRVSAHTHAFHDHKILKKVLARCVYSALQDAEADYNCVQFTVSNQGSLQLIVNRFIYYYRYTYRNGVRRWNCIEGRHKTCKAQLMTTPDNYVQRRIGAHNHPFHDKSIMKKVRIGVVYSALQDAEQKATKKLKA